MFRTLDSVPLINAPFIVSKPQLGNETGEPDEQRRVEQALPAERRAPNPVRPANEIGAWFAETL